MKTKNKARSLGVNAIKKFNRMTKTMRKAKPTESAQMVRGMNGRKN